MTFFLLSQTRHLVAHEPRFRAVAMGVVAESLPGALGERFFFPMSSLMEDDETRPKAKNDVTSEVRRWIFLNHFFFDV